MTESGSTETRSRPPDVASNRRGGTRIRTRLLHDKAAVVGALLVSLFVVAALGAPWFAPYDPIATNATEVLSGPSRAHPLGTDELGRDTLSRLLHGSRVSLVTASIAAVIVMTLGVTLGLMSAMAGGHTDTVIMRAVDGILAFPNLVLALAIAGTLGGGLFAVVMGLTMVWWAGYARIVRGIALTVRERPFVTAARVTGASEWSITVRHILPNVIPPIIVLLTIEMGSLILAVASLSFLGIGVPPPTPEWGTMINEGRNFLSSAPRLMLVPGLAIFCTVLGFNLLGDGLRDVLDPKNVG